MPAASASPLRSYRILTAALMGALFVIGSALVPVLSSHRRSRSGQPVHTHAPGLWLYAGILVLGVVEAVLIHVAGYRVPPVLPGASADEARAVGLRAYQQSMFLRFALSEAVAIIAIAALFAADSNTALPFVLAAVIALLLMAYHVWPSESLINRVQQRLDRNGGNSDLSNALRGAR